MGTVMLDLGTGTGIIAISLLASLHNARAAAADISPGALETCKRNAQANGVSARLTCVQSNWFEIIDGHFDAIVSNPPYIPSYVIGSLSPEVREYDPSRALDGGAGANHAG